MLAGPGTLQAVQVIDTNTPLPIDGVCAAYVCNV